MLLVVLWSAFDVFLEAIVGSYFFVAVVVQYVKVICYRVVRCDDALECTVSWEVLAYFRVDECVACCAEVCVRIVALIFCLFGTLLRVTGPPPSLVPRTEDMWQK